LSASASASPKKSGRINLGLEGTPIMGAMTGCATSFLTTADLSEMLIGSEQIPQSAAKTLRMNADERLQIRDLVAEDDAGAVALDGVNLASARARSLALPGYPATARAS
jgi:hypothetical protein